MEGGGNEKNQFIKRKMNVFFVCFSLFFCKIGQ